jgi:hypothetical protein
VGVRGLAALEVALPRQVPGIKYSTRRSVRQIPGIKQSYDQKRGDHPHHVLVKPAGDRRVFCLEHSEVPAQNGLSNEFSLCLSRALVQKVTAFGYL